jgi:hypothetical protein
MRKGSLLVLALLLPLAAGAVAQAETWRTYGNARYGTSVSYPADLFSPGEEPANGDGLAFSASDGAKLLVFGQNNALGETPATLRKRLVADSPESYSAITYEKADKRSLTLSGTRGDTIFYERYVFSVPPDTIHAIVVTYPAALKDRYDRIVTRISRSLAAPKR